VLLFVVNKRHGSVQASDTDGRPVCVMAEGGPACFSFMGQQPVVGQSLLVIETSRSHLRHTNYDSSGRVKSLTQRCLPDNTQHSYKKSMLPAGLEPAIPTSELPQTIALGYGYIGTRTDTTQQTNICLGTYRRHMWLHIIRHATLQRYSNPMSTAAGI